VYQNPDVDWDEHTSIATVAAMVPKGVIVLLSALAFHGIGSQPARAVWLQLPMGATTPNIKYPPVRIVRTRVKAALADGVKTHVLNGMSVRITSPARTVADCFKYRREVGLELCLDVLRETVPHRAKAAEVLLYAKMNRVERFMLPYLEMLA
jgi:predicted transcriptional regulator of viral defense system